MDKRFPDYDKISLEILLDGNVEIPSGQSAPALV